MPNLDAIASMLQHLEKIVHFSHELSITSQIWMAEFAQPPLQFPQISVFPHVSESPEMLKIGFQLQHQRMNEIDDFANLHVILPAQ
jgi:hypothetical protein